MARLVLLLSIFFIMSFTSKDEDYFRQNIGQAYKLFDERCNKSSTIGRMEITFKDYECEFARKAIDDDITYQSRQTLIEAIQNFIKSIPPVDSYKVDEKIQYLAYEKRFNSTPSEIEELVTNCIEDKLKSKQNKPACRASAEVMLKNLELEQQKFVSQLNTTQQYIDYFKKNPKKIAEVLTGKCRQILENPWYRFDLSSHDKECEAALQAKEVNLRTEVTTPTQVKSKEYFHNNNIEATKIDLDCRKNNNNKDATECAAAASSIKEYKESQKLSEEYRSYFSTNMKDAKEFAHHCRALGAEPGNNALKCKVAIQIVNEHMERYRNLQKKKKYIADLKKNIKAAKEILKKGCTDKTIECEAASEVLAEQNLLANRSQLITELRNILSKSVFDEKTLNSSEKVQFASYKRNFTNNKEDTEEFVEICLKNHLIENNNNLECTTAARILLSLLEAEHNKEIEKKELLTKNSLTEQYQKYFFAHPEEIDKLLNGRCKDVFADSWYKSDPDMEDKECDEALAAKKKTITTNKENKLAQQHKQTKDYSYFLSNMQEAEEISKQCKKGIIVDISECETSISIVHEKIIEENNRADYVLYYNKHPLAAKFFIKWCKSSMLNFNIKCQAAIKAVKNNENKPLKTYNEELLITNINKLKNDMENVRKILNSECKTLFEDPWYYLDESIRSEECDAAAEVARMATEKNDSKNSPK